MFEYTVKYGERGECLMKHSLTEQMVLQQLGISDFRHMTKDKIVSFASMLPQMDSEVAQKALDQFPDFARMTLEALQEYKQVLDKASDSNSSSQKQCMDIYNRIIDSLQDCLSKDSLTFEEKKYYIEQMKEIAQMAEKKDSENKHFNWGMLAVGAAALVSAIGLAASVLGSNSDFHFPSNKS